MSPTLDTEPEYATDSTFRLIKATSDEIINNKDTKYPTITGTISTGEKIDYQYAYSTNSDNGAKEIKPITLNDKEWVGFTYTLDEDIIVYELYTLDGNGNIVQISTQLPKGSSINDADVQAIIANAIYNPTICY